MGGKLHNVDEAEEELYQGEQPRGLARGRYDLPLGRELPLPTHVLIREVPALPEYAEAALLDEQEAGVGAVRRQWPGGAPQEHVGRHGHVAAQGVVE